MVGHGDRGAGFGDGGCILRLEVPVGRPPTQLVGGRTVGGVPGRRDLQRARGGAQGEVRRRLGERQGDGPAREVGCAVAALGGPLQGAVVVVGVVQGEGLAGRQGRSQLQGHHRAVDGHALHREGPGGAVGMGRVDRELAGGRSGRLLDRLVEGQLDGLQAGRGAQQDRLALPVGGEVAAQDDGQAVGVGGGQRDRGDQRIRQRRGEGLPVVVSLRLEGHLQGLLEGQGASGQRVFIGDLDACHQFAAVLGEGDAVGQRVAVRVGEEAPEGLAHGGAPGRIVGPDE